MDSIINIDNLKAGIGDNIPSDYLPVKTNYNECNWDIVSGYFIAFSFNLELSKYSKEAFETDCKNAFLSNQISNEQYSVIRKAYFEKENYLKLSPTNLILHTQADENIKPKVNSASRKVAYSLLTLMGPHEINISNKNNDHFISEVINATLKKQLKSKAYTDHALTYLPYLKDKFLHDYAFLASKPSYMLENIASFMSLYSFLHTSQVALNIKEWREGLPKSKPLYFVIETEKVSSERTKVINSGWKSFAKASHNLFPMLSTLQLVQAKTSRKPIWQIFTELNELPESQQKICVEAFDNYCERFVEMRKLKKRFVESLDIKNAFDQLFDLALAQFDKSFADPSTTRYQANDKVVSALKEYTAKGFVKAKGRIGNILVLTQDHLLLLTNVIIGNKKQIRFNDLIEEFNLRGIYFDETSEERLIEFYERIGNVERMSDSGDDLNVRQTA